MHLTLVGEKGESDEVRLYSENEDRAFERDTTDKFTITATDVGALTAVKVKLCVPWWSSVHSDWHLQDVFVLNASTGLKVHFPHNAWVDKVDENITLQSASSEQVGRAMAGA